MYSRADLESIHRFCTRNRALLDKSERAGCFSCEYQFPPTAIIEWIPERAIGSDELDPQVTALCPRCEVDSVLPSAAPIVLDAELLREMRAYWFAES